LDDIDANSIASLAIAYNDVLSSCEAQTICNYLSTPTGTVDILLNAPGCNSPGEIANACGFTTCLPYGNYYFSKQEEIDVFQSHYPGCIDLQGDVWIGRGDEINISNLYGLNEVRSVSGDLRITNCLLTNLEGLNNLTTVGQYLGIGSDSLLTDLSGLENLISIGRSLGIYRNKRLSSLTGLGNISTIEGNLTIKENEKLIGLSGLENLESIGACLSISENESLINFSGLENLESISGELEVDNNNNLVSFDGLNNLEFIGGGIYIDKNDILIDITSIENVSSDSLNYLYITENPLLSICDIQCICDYLADPDASATIGENANGCSSRSQVEAACNTHCLPDGIEFTTQAQIDSFQIYYPDCNTIGGSVTIVGPDIVNLYGLSNITSIDGGLWIGNHDEGCPDLEGLNGLDKLTTIEGYFTVLNNPLLESLTGLENLTSVEGLHLENNASLVDISALNYLTSVGAVYIFSNPLLENLSGLDNLYSVGPLQISDNSSLSDLSALDGLTSMNGGLTLRNNDAMTSLPDLRGVDSLFTGIHISGNDALLNLSGLDSISKINGVIWGSVLTINDNDALVNLTGLEKLTYLSPGIGGFHSAVWIWDNDALTSLKGLDNLETVQKINILDNPLLSVCDIESICNYLEVQPEDIAISDNNTGCNSIQEVQDSCETHYGTEESPVSSQQSAVRVYPNPTSGSSQFAVRSSRSEHITIKIYDLHGREVATVIDQQLPAGEHTVSFDAGSLPAGVYIYLKSSVVSLQSSVGKLIKF
jgi:hypothetical protein